MRPWSSEPRDTARQDPGRRVRRRCIARSWGQLMAPPTELPQTLRARLSSTRSPSTEWFRRWQAPSRRDGRRKCPDAFDAFRRTAGARRRSVAIESDRAGAGNQREVSWDFGSRRARKPRRIERWGVPFAFPSRRLRTRLRLAAGRAVLGIPAQRLSMESVCGLANFVGRKPAAGR